MPRQKRFFNPVVTSVWTDRNLLKRAKLKAAMQKRSLNDVINYFLVTYVSDTPLPVEKRKPMPEEVAKNIETEARAEAATFFKKLGG